MFKVALKDRPNTRRGILSLTSSVYDPLGFVAPGVLPAKKLLQDLCREKQEWDDPISDGDGERWQKWKSQLVNLSMIHVTVNRCVRPACFGDLKTAELTTLQTLQKLHMEQSRISDWWMSKKGSIARF